jgi:hypothetical protein
MFKPQDIEDLIEHTAQKQGVHSMSVTPTPGGVPVAKADGFIDDDWLSNQIVKKGTGGKISVEDLPDGLAMTENGSIPPRILPDPLKTDKFKSSGTVTATKFLIADGTDLAVLIASKAGGGGIKRIETHLLPENNCYRAYDPPRDLDNANCSRGREKVMYNASLWIKVPTDGWTYYHNWGDLIFFRNFINRPDMVDDEYIYSNS